MRKSQQRIAGLEEENEALKLAQIEWASLNRKTEEENEALKCERAMLVKAVLLAESAFVMQVGSDYNDAIHSAWLDCKAAISATEQQSTAWLNEKKSEALEEAANKFMAGVAHELRQLASELRNASPESDIDQATRTT